MKTIEVPDSVAGQPSPAWEIAFQFPAQGQWTESDYLTYVRARGYELVDGRLEMLPVPTELHQLIVAYLYRTLLAWVRDHGGGVVLFAGLRVRTVAGRTREPDVAFMKREHDDRRANSAWQGADLVMEVVSQDDPARDRLEKRREYAQAGIDEYWIVDGPDASITVLRRERDVYVEHGRFVAGQRATSAALPGFEVDVTTALKPPPD